MTEKDEEELRRMGLPDRRKNTYEELEKKLDGHITEIENRFQRWFVRGLIAFSIIGVATTVALVGFGIVLNEQKETSDQLQALVHQNQQFALDIQQQRRDTVFNSCTSTNERNKATQAALKKGSDEDIKNAPTEAAKQEIARRRDVTIAIINAVLPVQDCESLVKEAVPSATPRASPTPTP